MDDTPSGPDRKAVAEDPAEWGIASPFLRNRSDPAGAAERARRWAEENAEAIRAYNAFVEEHGVVADDLRGW